MSASYWEDTVSEALSEFGIELTPEQLEAVCEAIEISHSNYGMAHGHDCIPNPMQTELEQSRRAAAASREEMEKSHQHVIDDLNYTIRNLRNRVAELEQERSAHERLR